MFDVGLTAAGAEAAGAEGEAEVPQPPQAGLQQLLHPIPAGSSQQRKEPAENRTAGPPRMTVARPLPTARP